jgi:aminopeptidase YwaD
MGERTYSVKAKRYLDKLSLEIPNRRVGGEGNRLATDFFAETISSFGFETEAPSFDCIDWEDGGAALGVGGENFSPSVSPYSLGCQVKAPLVVVSSIAELEAIRETPAVYLLCGDLTTEQLMPKHFPFYNPERHRRIIGLLEAKGPLAIIAATGRNPELAGGVYPFPLIEDGDLDIPSVYMTEEQGDRLGRHQGQEIAVTIRSERIPATGCNVIARKGMSAYRRVVVGAHIDAKIDSPGAIDNAAGVVGLLLLAETLAGFSGGLGVEIVAFNGEDYYAAPGQILYAESLPAQASNIALGINIDGAGYLRGKTAYSLYGCPPGIVDAVDRTFQNRAGMAPGEQWYQGDHAIFVQNQVPAMAITSEHFGWLSAEITHTPKDRPEIVDCDRLVDIALALRDLIVELCK